MCRGPTINQACATGVRCLATAAQNLASNDASCALVITADKTSNGPHIYYPDPSGPGGTGQHEDWVLDNFSLDPLTGQGMVQTAENVARKYQITTSEQNEVTLRRYAQYQDALADDSRFLKRFMTLPFDVPDPGSRNRSRCCKATKACIRRRPTRSRRSSRCCRTAPSPMPARPIRPTATPPWW